MIIKDVFSSKLTSFSSALAMINLTKNYEDDRQSMNASKSSKNKQTKHQLYVFVIDNSIWGVIWGSFPWIQC